MKFFMLKMYEYMGWTPGWFWRVLGVWFRDGGSEVQVRKYKIHVLLSLFVSGLHIKAAYKFIVTEYNPN